MNLDISVKQTQTLSPQMIQAMKILQMGTQELAEYVEEAAQENPVLELEIDYGRQDDTPELFRKLEWLASTDPQNYYYHRQDSEDTYDALGRCGVVDDGEEDLYHDLIAQLDALYLEPELADCARFLAAALDGNGWLDEPLQDLAREIHRPVPLLERALEIVQSLEPAGVAARDLSECLQIQLLRRQPVDELALAIAASYLDDLSKHHYGHIAKRLGATQDAVRRSCQLIRTLEPRPALAASSREQPIYITPDIIVARDCGHLELLIDDRFTPSLSISTYYTRMLKEDDTPEVRDYLSEKIRQAKYLLQAVEQRRSTLLACAQCIVEAQEDFFYKGPGHLAPLTLQDVARQVNVHESTVSRAIRDKYLQCSMGVYPFSAFFSRGLGTEEGGLSSPDAAKALLKKLISEEDKARPLSDQKLCERMAAQGCALSRRTVAKYRSELRIPGTSERRMCGQPV